MESKELDEKYKMVMKIADVFKAFGDLNRLLIINILASNMVDKISVSELAKMLGITQPAASQHLKILKNIGILVPKKEGYHVYYMIDIDAFLKQKEYIDLVFQYAFHKCDSNKDKGEII